MSIDIHVHPWTKNFMMRNEPIMKACRFFRVSPTDLPLSISELLEGMERSDVELSVILGQDTHATQNTSFRHYTIRNEQLAKIASRSNGRLIPFAGVDPNSPREALKQLRKAFKNLGFRGLKIHSSANSVYPNDKRMFPLYDLCQENGAPVLFHTGTTGLGDCDIKFSKPEFLDEVCRLYPDLKVVMAHFGWPWTEVAVAIALRHPNVYIDISGWKPRYIPSSVLTYMNGPLQDRFLFGTDYPMIRHEAWLSDFNESLRKKLKPGVAEKLLRSNAKRLLRL